MLSKAVRKPLKKVLLPDELKQLLRVRTTPAQARQIVRRSQKALDLTRRGFEGTVNVACPHCEAAGSQPGLFVCGNCAYQAVARGQWACTKFNFGGVNYDYVCGYIKLTLRTLIVMEPFVPQAVEDWLQGHIEWAQAVIDRAKRKRKGVKP